jgi:hypothetical protein
MTTRPTFMAITSTGGYIGRIYWENSGIHPDFPRWGSVHFLSNHVPHFLSDAWAGSCRVILQVVNWRFHD